MTTTTMTTNSHINEDDDDENGSNKISSAGNNVDCVKTGFRHKSVEYGREYAIKRKFTLYALFGSPRKL